MAAWKEGRHLDVWSVTHFLSGIVFTGWVLSLGIDLFSAFIIYLALAILWEVFEVFKNIEEYRRNRVIDVLVGLAGFLSAFAFIGDDGLMNRLWLIAFTSLYSAMGLYGYINYKRRIGALD